MAATITLNDASVPSDLDGPIKFSFGSVTFELEKDGSYETDNPFVIGDARNHPWLKVDEGAQPVEEAVFVEADPNNPHQNRAADHLAVEGSQEAREAAARKNLEIRAQVTPGLVDAEDDQPQEEAQAEQVEQPQEEAQAEQVEQPTTDPNPQTPIAGQTQVPEEVAAGHAGKVDVAASEATGATS